MVDVRMARDGDGLIVLHFVARVVLRRQKGAVKDRHRYPQRDLPNWRLPEKLRCGAGRLLVAETPAWDLLLCAKHLFIAANGMPGCGATWVDEGG
jgi:hypothetical protein